MRRSLPYCCACAANGRPLRRLMKCRLIIASPRRRGQPTEGCAPEPTSLAQARSGAYPVSLRHDDMSLDETTRKRMEVETAPDKSSRAKVLKLADKSSNLRAITANPPPDWSV